MQSLTKHRTVLFLVLASGSLAVPACGGNSSSSSDESSTTGGTGGVGGTGGSGGGDAGSSTNTTATNVTSASGGDGGTSGSPVTNGGAGGTSGGAGGTTGGGSDSGGTSGSGGAGGDGGSAGTTVSTSAGGSAGTGGDGGSGGIGPTGVIGVLGESCDEPGQLACAGNHQKLTVVCGGDGEWEVNETCGETEYCDSTAGDTTGVCVEPEGDCVERGIGERFCVTPDAYSCAPDGLRPARAEVCAAGCEGGACFADRDPCPLGDDDTFLNCDSACGAVSSQCETGGVYVTPAEDEYVFRTGSAQESVLGCDGERYVYFVNPGIGQMRALATSPWSVSLASSSSSCGLPESQCALGQGSVGFFIYTDDPEAPPINILLERVPSEETCPES